MALNKVIYVDGETVITAENLNDIQDAIIALENAPAQGLTEDMKQALLQIARKVAYIDDQGQTYYDDLYDAFYPPKTVVLITAVFEQGSTVIYDDTALDDLKQFLTVTAKYDDNTTAILADSAYTLSGLLEAGTSTVIVAYNGLTTTFTVNVTARPTLSSISATYTQSGTVYDTDTLDSLKADLVVTAHYSDSSTQTVPAADYTLSGTLTAGTSTITVSYGGKTTTFNVTVTETLYSLFDTTFNSESSQINTGLVLLENDRDITVAYDIDLAGNQPNDWRVFSLMNATSPWPGINTQRVSTSTNAGQITLMADKTTRITALTDSYVGKFRVVITHSVGNIWKCWYRLGTSNVVSGQVSSAFQSITATLRIGSNDTSQRINARYNSFIFYPDVISDDRINDFLG